MLFFLKRTWKGGLAGLAVLALLGFGLRSQLSNVPAFKISPAHALLGFALFLAILASDVTVHLMLSKFFGAGYRRRHRELAAIFGGQTGTAMLTGALMAGVGEETVFRGLSAQPLELAIAAVVFGLLHHIRARFWPFTLWAIYQGLLLAGAIYLTGALFVPMLAHFLHDLAGFLIFRRMNVMSAGEQPARSE